MRQFIVGSVLLLSTVLSAQQSGLTSAQIEKPATTSWPTFNGDYSGRRYSTLAKITAANVNTEGGSRHAGGRASGRAPC